MDADDRKLFEDSLRQLAEAHAGESLDTALDDLGWTDAYDEDSHLAVSLLFEQQGAVNAASTALGHVVFATAGLRVNSEAEPGSASAIVLPMPGGHAAPARLTGSTLDVRGIVPAAVLDGGTVMVAASDGPCDIAYGVATSSLTTEPVHGLDPALGLVRVSATELAAREGSPVYWSDAVAAAQLALAHELVGASRAMLRLARDHAIDRIQFGRSIASFQAIRHRLADSLVAIQSADAANAAAWAAPSPVASTFAKVLAGRAARLTAKHAQQVLAGMGFTQEHPLHRYVRRTIVLDELFGSSRLLIAQIGAEALRTRRIPEMVPL
jgi:hypothetical protein